MKMSQPFLVRGLICLAALSATYVAIRAASSGTSTEHGAAAGRSPATLPTAGPLPAGRGGDAKRDDAPSSHAVVVGSREFDFGTVDPFRSYLHSFTIQNSGKSPLVLSSKGTTCSCLSVDIDPHTVDPGRTASVTVTWDARATDRDLNQRASIATNDPAQSLIEFSLRGKTRIVLAAEPPSLVAPRIRPMEKTRLETKIVSLEWNAFSLDVRPSLAGAEWTLDPLPESDLIALKAKSGWRLAVTLPADMPSGALRERIHLTARRIASEADAAEQPDDAVPEVVEREISLEGGVLGRLTVYGQHIDNRGHIKAGTLDSRTGFNGVFTLRVNDRQPDLNVTGVTADPAFITARLEPYSKDGTPGFYKLHVEVPPSDSPAAYVGEKQGQLTLLFDHPRITKLELGIEFIVMKSSGTGVERRAAATAQSGPTQTAGRPR
jgi:hypothetical protein